MNRANRGPTQEHGVWWQIVGNAKSIVYRRVSIATAFISAKLYNSACSRATLFDCFAEKDIFPLEHVV